jgi:predicted N-acetyltransferase YhbS
MHGIPPDRPVAGQTDSGGRGGVPVGQDLRMNDAVLHIRRAQPHDSDAVWQLTRQFATSFVPTAGTFTESYSSLVSRSDTLLVVADAPGTGVVGYALASTHLTLFADGPVTWIEELMVEPDRRRRGAGSALMRAVEAWSVEQGATYVALATRRAEEFYAAIGYTASATFLRKLLS